MTEDVVDQLAANHCLIAACLVTDGAGQLPVKPQKTSPSNVHKVAITLVKLSRSLRKTTPNTNAKRMLVSRKAATKARGAFVNTQVAMA